MKFYKNNIARLIKKHKTLIFLFIVCFIFLYPKRIADYSTSFDFVQDGCIIFALGTDNNAYFLNNGQVLGYHFELMKKYCHTTEQQPVFVIEEDIDKRMDLLLANKVDIIACDAKTDSIYQLKNVNSIYIDKNFSQDIWTVNDKNSGLAKNINLWLSAYIDTKEYRFLSAKYNRKVNYNKPHTHISNYDDLIRKYSEKINWDWRLTASLIYQESQFNPAVISRKDAFGLMQIRQQTAKFLGFDSIDNNKKNIAAGTKLIRFLEKHFAQDSTISDTERVKFVLAAYNAGHGKIDICRKNTRQKGRNASLWLDVEHTNQRKNRSKSSKTKQEPALSRETILFVSEILERYEHYKNFFHE